MKKFYFTICFLFLTMAVKAQFYVGGSIGYGYVKSNSSERTSTFKIIPEVGYRLNNDWSIGLAVGYKKGSCSVGNSYYTQNTRSKALGIQPYVRYSPIHVSVVDFFIDGCFTYEKIVDQGMNMNVGFKPGFSIRPINNMRLVANFGFIGAEFFKSEDGSVKNGIAGIDLDVSDITLGVLFDI